jgi:hypothetical protein
MSTITKKELIDRIAKGTKTKLATTKALIQCFLEEIITELAKGNRSPHQQANRRGGKYSSFMVETLGHI